MTRPRLNILFDLDGTLTDSREGIMNSIRHALTSVDIVPPPESELLWCIGPPLRRVADSLGLDQSRTAMVGDRVYDVEGGRHNGIVTVGVTWVYRSDEELAGADDLCRTPPELIELLSSL